MIKTKSAFVCQACASSFLKWAGRCEQCGEWNSLVEEVIESQSSKISLRSRTRAGRKLADQPSDKSPKNRKGDFEVTEILVSLGEVLKKPQDSLRISTHNHEFDRVLGGTEKNLGMVPGAVMLLGGEPGIGKSTLLSQLSLDLISNNFASEESPIVYVCGEESPSQITMRLARMIESRDKKSLFDLKKVKNSLQFVTSSDLDAVILAIEKSKPSLVIIDSIQTIRSSQLTGASGSIGQVRECADELTQVAKAYNIPLFMVGHVTKDGSISGPKVLEHIVDSVLELAGERTGELRLLRALKNRFGATDEVGVFKVTSAGYQSIDNPSSFFIDQSQHESVGSAISCVCEGTRALLLEVQALVISSNLAMPRRVGRGIELSRIQVLSAVLQKHASLGLGNSDIFLSVAGGFSIKEPAVDLATAMAIVSSLKNKPLPAKTVFVGEVGLLGEIRSVQLLDRRIKEAKRLGYKNIISKNTHKNIRSVIAEFF